MLVELPTWQGAEPVAIRLPNLAATRCKALVVCGEVKTKDARLLKWLKGRRELSARYGSREATGYVHVVFGERKDKKGFHLDIVAKDYLKGESLPVTNKVGEVQEAIERLQGQKVEVEVEGYFRVPKESLPPIIRSAIVETKADDVTIKTAGGTFSVRGTPICRINWYVVEEGDVLIHLMARRSTTIDETYLESAFDLVESAFETFIRGGKQNVGR